MVTTVVVGDCATTTALAIAASGVIDDVILVEADRSGGSLAAWLDTPSTPSLSTIVTTAGRNSRGSLSWSTIEPLVRTSASGVRFIPAPIRAREATRAIEEAERLVFPVIADRPQLHAIVDLGWRTAADPITTSLTSAATILVTHRQDRSSAAAATIRIERLAEIVEGLAATDRPVIVALIGDSPFDGAEISRFVDDAVAQDEHLRPREWHVLADDPLAAAVLAGRAGVSAKRLARLPLIRSASGLAHRIAVASGRRPANDTMAPGDYGAVTGRHETARR